MDLFLDINDFDMISDDFEDHDQRCDLDFDPNFPPMPRERANTWHGPPRSASKDEDGATAARLSTPGYTADESVDSTASAAISTTAYRDPVQGSAPGTARKATARRNAWGNMSYADLIAKAIESSSEKRLTLSEIYAWLVENVPFFKDKGETNSSAGWKNSIRHNLSLHNRFVRVQNEGAGKSSWWTVNPDKGPCKVPRRRAATMDNSKAMNQKRGRQRRSEPVGTVSSTNQSSVDVDSSPQSYFPLSPEFRGRVSSNASSIGRLSPIPATFEVDMDLVVPTTTQCATAFNQWNNATAATDTLSDCLAGILMDDIKTGMNVTPNLTMNSGLKTEPLFLQTGSSNNANFMTSSQYTASEVPIGMLHTTMPKAEAFSMNSFRGAGLGSPNNTPNMSLLCVGGNMSGNCGFSSTELQMSLGQQLLGQQLLGQQLYKTPSVNDLLLPTNRARLLPSPLSFGETKHSLHTSAESYVNNSLLTTIPWSHQELPKPSEWPGQTVSGWSEMKNPLESEPQTRQRSFTFSSGKLDQNSLKELLIAKPLLRTNIQKLLHLKRQQLFAAAQTESDCGVANQVTSSSVQPPDYLEQPQHSMLQQLLTGEMQEPSIITPLALDHMQTKMEVKPVNLPSEPASLPSDLDLSYLNTESTTDIECNIDQVIQHELTFGDELDFTFDPIQPNWSKNSSGGNGDSLTSFLSY